MNRFTTSEFGVEVGLAGRLPAAEPRFKISMLFVLFATSQ